jgi:hypothetical protein
VGSRERLRTFAVAEQFTDKPEQLAVGEGFARGNSGTPQFWAILGTPYLIIDIHLAHNIL